MTELSRVGDMLELGSYERQGHEMVGLRAAQVADVLVTLGPRAHVIAEAARRAGMKQEAIIEFEEPKDAVRWMKENLSEKDAAGDRSRCSASSMSVRSSTLTA